MTEQQKEIIFTDDCVEADGSPGFWKNGNKYFAHTSFYESMKEFLDKREIEK